MALGYCLGGFECIHYTAKNQILDKFLVVDNVTRESLSANVQNSLQGQESNPTAKTRQHRGSQEDVELK